MQTFKKPPLTVLLCLIVCFTLTSCFNTKNKSESVPDNYSLYSQYVDKVVKKFEPEGFEILNSTADIYSSGFPENEYFEERDDLYDGNPLQPKNRKAIYLNSTNGILACMTFLYSEEELGKRMLTIDSLPAEAVATFQKEDDINIQETYEMVLCDKQTLKRCNSASLRLLPHRRSRPLCHTFRAFRHKQDSTLVAEQTAISSIFAFFVSIYSVFVERPG